MKFLAPALTLAVVTLCPGLAFGQILTITPQGTLTIRDAKLQLTTELGGRGSDHAFVSIVNNSGGPVKYEIHTHDPINFIEFHEKNEDDGHGHLKLPIKDTVKKGGTDRYPLYIFLKNGPPGVYQDLVHVTVWNAQGKQIGTKEFELVATFLPKGGINKTRPQGYAMWTMDDGRIRRVDEKYLPIRIYSDDPEQQQVVERAMTVWNQAGKTAGIKKPFFELINKRDDADGWIEWKDKLNANTLGMAYLADYGNLSVVGRVAPKESAIEMLRLGKDIPAKQRASMAETLIQELGHLLGLGHSEGKDDVMSQGHPPHHPDLRFVALSSRDFAAMAWLVAQPFNPKTCVPIIPRRALSK